MEASIDRYLRQMNYPDNIITGRPFKTSQETLNSKGKLLWHQSRQGKTTQWSSALQSNGRRRFWIEGKLGNHNGVALTNANLKNLSEHRRFKGRQDHYNASFTKARSWNANNPDQHCSNNYSIICKWQQADVDINNTMTNAERVYQQPKIISKDIRRNML